MKYEMALGALLATAFWFVIAIAIEAPPVSTLKDFAGPVATVFAASVAGWVAYTLGQAQIEVAERNWQTSNEKIVLELFDKRLAIFEDIRGIVTEVVSTGKAPFPVQFRLLQAIDRVPYFFGPEVQDYVRGLHHLLSDLDTANAMMESDDPERPKWVNKRTEKFVAVGDFYKEAPALFGPYLRAHQKVL